MICNGWAIDGVDKYGACIYRCNGTKEREICHCGGDKSKCDFYENVRAEGELEQKSNEIIKVNGEPFNMIEGLYKIIDRSLKDSSVRSVEIVVKDSIHIKINRREGE